MLICRKICFAAIYAVLAQNLFCCDLRTFVWRKIYSEIVRVEKKGQISGMVLPPGLFAMHFFPLMKVKKVKVPASVV